MGGAGGIVEIDETYVGPKERGTGLRGAGNRKSKKVPVVSLMERSENGGHVRSFPMERVTLENLKPIMQEHVEVGSNIQTDEAAIYIGCPNIRTTSSLTRKKSTPDMRLTVATSRLIP